MICVRCGRDGCDSAGPANDPCRLLVDQRINDVECDVCSGTVYPESTRIWCCRAHWDASRARSESETVASVAKFLDELPDQYYEAGEAGCTIENAKLAIMRGEWRPK